MKKQTIVIIAAIAACLLVWLGATKLPALQIRAEKLPGKETVPAEEGKGWLTV